MGGERARARDLGIRVGILRTGKDNAITDVRGVLIGHRTVIEGETVRTGVTAILPHGDNMYQSKVPAAVYVGNGFGKLAGSTQVNELGTMEAPVILTSTMAVGTAINAVNQFTLNQPGNDHVRSVNAIVGETSDAYLNDVRQRAIREQHVIDAIDGAKGGPVEEGSVGAGAGTRLFKFKGGIGTSSRVVAIDINHRYTVGVLVQSNFWGTLVINGAPVGLEMGLANPDVGVEVRDDGSCMIVVATDAPLTHRNLMRLAQRALHGLTRTGSYMANGSGDYSIAFSTAYRIGHGNTFIGLTELLSNDAMSPLFRGVMEATEEAVYNSLFMATTVTGFNGRTAEAIDLNRVIEICRKYGVIGSTQGA